MSEYVAKIVKNTGPRGLRSDSVFLKNGKCLEITEKSILLCERQDDSDKQQGRQAIDILDHLECSTNDAWNYIEKVDMWDTGGGTLVDVLRLNGDRFIGISDECAVLYKNDDTFYDGDHEYSQIINL